MAARSIEQGVPLPEFLKHATHADGVVLEARDLAKSFGGIKAVTDASLAVRDRTLHALIGPNGAGKTTVFNLITGMFAPDRGSVLLAGRSIAGLPPYRIAAAGLGRSFQITNLFPRRVDRGESAPRGAGARCVAFQRLGRRAAQRARDGAHGGADPLPRAVGDRTRRGGIAVVRRPASARHGLGARRRAARAAARRAARWPRRERSASVSPA